MKKHMRVAVAAMLSLAGSWQAMAQNYEKGDYGFLYCHMSGRGEWTAYALSRDGQTSSRAEPATPI